ncbi:MAG: PDZ domain-containing protein, partial [Muribaculaceae bacterium]|nr:PDZ domain-containing protein [Muribaculaceae bacterium]
DYAEMLSEILGELNASHTGGRYSAPGASMRTASLGAFYDESYTGDGLKVAEVLPGGALSTAGNAVEAGEIIVAVDGEPIVAGKEYFTLLEGKAGKKVRLTVEGKNGARRDVTVKPSSSDQALLYRRWVEHNRHVVDSLSGGRIGYVHVQGMNSPSFRAVYEDMFGRHRNCEAIVVDTRFNGGGWLHNDLAVLLSGKEYVRFTPRGRYIGSEPFSQWFKPSVMLVNEGNYSDGHGSPYTYQTLGLGEVIGAPIPGTMTAVWWENQVDPSIIFGIPQVTSADMNGNALENKQLDPDVVIYNAPADVLNGHDAQLAGAVARLLEKIGK